MTRQELKASFLRNIAIRRGSDEWEIWQEPGKVAGCQLGSTTNAGLLVLKNSDASCVFKRCPATGEGTGRISTAARTAEGLLRIHDDVVIEFAAR